VDNFANCEMLGTARFENFNKTMYAITIPHLNFSTKEMR
jgi:hypothetical protein